MKREKASEVGRGFPCPCRRPARFGTHSDPDHRRCGGRGYVDLRGDPKDHRWLRAALEAGYRGDCLRRQVGAVLVSPAGDVLGRGANVALVKPGCADEEDGLGCAMVGGHCVRTVHAEVAAVADAARRGLRTDGATMYSTLCPCWMCFKAAVSAGVRRVVYVEFEPYGVGDYLCAPSDVELVEL